MSDKKNANESTRPSPAEPAGPARSAPSLDDKFDLNQDLVLLNGSQAVVRLMLMQAARDKAHGLKTAGYISGYRGSPIAGLEGQMQRVRRHLDEANISFQPGLNEDLAATAVWGAQQAELRGEGKYDGVFSIWYGKGPGVDRSGDVFRHANHAGTSKHGGVLALMGDDHTCESSTSAHQSEFALVDAMMPILNPAGVQEIIDFGLIGWELSRYAGVWVGIKCVKDNIESTAVADGRPDRVTITYPDPDPRPEDGLNIRLGDSALAKEARLHDFKRDAILAFAGANELDKMVWSGGEKPNVVLITTGKSYLDTRQALDILGIDETNAAQYGIRLYKIAMTWPLNPASIDEAARNANAIIVIEEKRSLIETQIKEQLYGHANAPSVVGKKDESGTTLFPAKGALEPIDIANAIGTRVLPKLSDGPLKKQLGDRIARTERTRKANRSIKEVASRIPYFCSGCPHNSSTVVPTGSRAYAGIGCHYMVQWMNRETEGFTHMGGEGANWIGEALFSTRDHVFQNLGDGTYIHSGSLAVRAAVAAGTNITYKILYNDAVAMTGGQALDGGLTVAGIAGQMMYEGAKQVVIVSDEPEKYDEETGRIPAAVSIHHRDDLQTVQAELARTPGVTVLIYDQTCAAEKRRRRKRGVYPDPDKRVFINTDVCEGCGDCGVQSNCVSIVPVETELGRKRAIDQSTCNKDYSCLKGFCPSFVTVHGGRLRKAEAAEPSAEILASIDALSDPDYPEISSPYSMVITGVGGTGVVTISAVLGQAAFLEGKGFGSIDMTGLAQKGGAVACHLRISDDPENIHAIRAGLGGADAILGCDLVVTGSEKVLETIRSEHTQLVVNDHEMITGEFTQNTQATIEGAALRRAIRDTAGGSNVTYLNATAYAEQLFGNSIASNMFMLGCAYQLGLVPIGARAIKQAIKLNDVAVAINKRAFDFGRLAIAKPDRLASLLPDGPAPSATDTSLDALINDRARRLTDYQNASYAQRFRTILEPLKDRETELGNTSEFPLTRAAAKSLYKLMAYKDEYEVARLYVEGGFQSELSKKFEGDFHVEFHLAPPLLSKTDAAGHPVKRTFGPWMLKAFEQLAKFKHLRGTKLDIFGYTGERRAERAAITQFEDMIAEINRRLDVDTKDVAQKLLELPLSIRGFGHVKEANARRAEQQATVLLNQLRNPDRSTQPDAPLQAAE